MAGRALLPRAILKGPVGRLPSGRPLPPVSTPWGLPAVSPSPLERLGHGDATAVQDCLTAYGGLVASIARKLLHSSSDVDDAVQDVFIELWQKAARFDATRGSPETFVGTVARRRVIDRIRKQARRPESELIEDTRVSDDEPLPA